MQDPLIGKLIARYEIRECLQKTDFFGVYKAYDTELHRFVRLKTILHSSEYSSDARDQFLIELKVLAKLKHPNISNVLDSGLNENNLYMVTEYVDGNPLSTQIGKPIAWHETVKIISAIMDGLAYAHSQGVLHGDLKPDNIIITLDHQPILSDFRLLNIIEEDETHDVTGSNIRLATPYYISPEEVLGEMSDARSDVYSLGVIFYEMVTGKKLFYSPNAVDVVIQHIKNTPPKPRDIVPSIPKAIEAVILKALAKDPEKRYRSINEFARALKGAKDLVEKREKKKPRRLALIFVPAFVAVLLFAFIFRNQIFPPETATASSNTPTQSSQIITGTPDVVIPLTTMTKTPFVTPVATNTSAPAIQIDQDVALSGTKLPTITTLIDVDTVSRIQELARWGSPNIYQISFLPDDKLLLSATSAGLYYFNPFDLTAHYFVDGRSSLTALSISNDGLKVATGDKLGTVVIWDIVSGKKEYQKVVENALQINSMDFSPDGSSLAFSDISNRVYLWEISSDEITRFDRRHTLEITDVIFSHKGDEIYTVGADSQFLIWNIHTGQLRDKIVVTQKLNDASVSSDGHYFAAAMNDSTIQIWDLLTGSEVKTIYRPDLATDFTSIEFLPSATNPNVIVGSADGYVRRWQIFNEDYTWQSILPDFEGAISPVELIAISNQGSRVVIKFENGLMESWSFEENSSDGRLGATGNFKSNPVIELAISQDEKFVVYQKGNSLVEILSVNNPDRFVQIPGSLPSGDPVSPTNNKVVLQYGDQDTLSLYELSVDNPSRLSIFRDYPVSGLVSFSDDGQMVFAAQGKAYNYWSTSTGMELKANHIKNIGQCRAVYRYDDSLVAAGSAIGIIYTDTHLDDFCSIAKAVRSTSVSSLRDGSIVVQTSRGRQVSIWDFSHEEDSIYSFSIHSSGEIVDSAISSKGNLLVVSTDNGIIEVYNLNTHEFIKALDFGSVKISQVKFSSGDKFLIVGLSDGTLRFWGIIP